MSEPKDEKWKAAWNEIAPEGKANEEGLRALGEKMGLPEPKPEFVEKVKAVMAENDGWITWPQVVEIYTAVKEASA